MILGKVGGGWRCIRVPKNAVTLYGFKEICGSNTYCS